MSETTILKSENLDLFYGDHQALKSISIEIPEKEITALIGPSGFGKSTFMKTINRMNDLVPGVTIRGKMLYRDMDMGKGFGFWNTMPIRLRSQVTLTPFP